ncbi:MAG: hypothetical protein JW741_20050 [Sedimentisphaerales bacterium]|nr:hypothetical protein [Sedimentisphaerales bacterium]
MNTNGLENMNTRFLMKAALSDTLTSSLRRARVYADGVTDREKQFFKDAFKTQLSSLAKAYANPVSDHTHVQNIRGFAESLSQDFAVILQDSHIRVGVAQKGLNLFLKYLWSLRQIPEPPHCPIDAIVLREIHYDARWTLLDSIELYERIITLCRQAAADQSISQWELELWNREA